MSINITNKFGMKYSPFEWSFTVKKKRKSWFNTNLNQNFRYWSSYSQSNIDQNEIQYYDHNLSYDIDLEWLKVGWHLLMVMPNSLIKYAALDEETKEFFTHMFVGSMPAAKIKNKVLALIAKGVLKHDVLSLMTGKKGIVPELAN